MRVNRSMFVGFLALVVAIGMLGANGYFWWLAPSQEVPSDSPYRSDTNRPSADWPNAEVSEFGAEWDEAEVWNSPYRDVENSPTGMEPARRFFPHHAEPRDIAQADGLAVPPAQADRSSPQQSPPPLLLPDVAAPISEPAADDWMSRLIRQELPEASAEEVRIWSQELKGFEPEVVRDILRMRKNVLASPPTRLGTRPELAPSWPDDSEPDLPSPHGLVPPPLEDVPVEAHSVANRLEPSLAALEHARDLILNNLANAHTVGFKRSRVMLAPLPYQNIQETIPHDDADADATPVSVGWGVELSSTPLDVSQGPLKKTQEPLDVAIEGPGFFQIRVGDEVLYTRCGMWTTNDQRQLCLMTGNQPRLVEPPITIPVTAASIVIVENGLISALPAGDFQEATPLGRIQLVRFPNPTGLKPRGGHLLAATKTCGLPQVGTPQTQGLGVVRQGMLELSNVSRDEELEQFQTIQSHWQLLKQLAGTSGNSSLPGPVARRPASRTQRASGNALPAPSRPSLEPLRKLGNQGRDLIEEYLQSERMQTIKRTLGLK